MAPLFTRRLHYVFLLAALTLLALAIYAPAFCSPPVLDDYYWLYHGARSDGWGRLLRVFDPMRGIFYRPLSAVWHQGIYSLFGSDPIGYRVTVLAWLVADAFLFAVFLRRWLDDRRLAVAGALLLVAASPCWQDLARWSVGVSDFGCLTGCLAALACFMGGRPLLAAVCMIPALGFKENASIVPALLALLWWTGGARGGWRGALRSIGPCALLSAGYIVTRVVALRRHDFAAGTAYAVEADDSRLFANLAGYAKWAFDALVPGLALSGWKEWVFGWFWVTPWATALAVLMWLVVFGWLAWRRRAAGAAGCWVAVGLIFTLLTPAQAYRYYMVYALPGLIALVLLALRLLGPRRLVPALAAWTLLAAAGGGYYFHRLDRTGWDLGYIDGTNQLARRADVVRRVRAALAARGDWVPGDTLVVEGVEGWAFQRSLGVRVWTGDPDATACERDDLAWRGGRLVIRGTRRLMGTVCPDVTPRPLECPIDPRRIVYLRRHGDQLIDHTDVFRAAQR